MAWFRLEERRWYDLFDQGRIQAGSIAWRPIDKRSGLPGQVAGFGVDSVWHHRYALLHPQGGRYMGIPKL